MQIDENLVLYLEQLARIELSAEERTACQIDLQNILSYFDQLGALDTEGVLPLTQAFARTNIDREDQVCASLPNEALLANAPGAQQGAFRVFHTLD